VQMKLMAGRGTSGDRRWKRVLFRLLALAILAGFLAQFLLTALQLPHGRRRTRPPTEQHSAWPLSYEALTNHTAVSKLPCGRSAAIPTSQALLATGFVFFNNLYFLNGSFLLVEEDNATQPTINVENWIKYRPEGVARYFGVSAVKDFPCNVSNSTVAMRHIDSAIMITDFLPQYEPHLYHMIENMLGVWATLDHFLGAGLERGTWPDFLVLPQNNQHEFGDATVALIRAMFPRIQIMDQDRFSSLTTHGAGLHFRQVVASDRSGVDHGGINQMIAGISSVLPKHTWKLSKRVCTSCRAVHPAARTLPVVTFVDRRMSENRRLDHQKSRDLFSFFQENNIYRPADLNIGTRAPWCHLQWIRFETLSFCQQVQVAHSSSVLFGVHGNGLSHVLWMSRPGALIEIFPGSYQRMLAFQQFAEAVQLLYFGLDSGTGQVCREGSCNGTLEGGTLVAGCEINKEEMNTIIFKIDVEQVVCLVCQAVVEAGLATQGLPPCTFCQMNLLRQVRRLQRQRPSRDEQLEIPSCVSAQSERSRSASSMDNFTKCYHKGMNYTCEDLRPRHVLREPNTLAPSDECLGGGLGWGTCQNGEFLCREGSQYRIREKELVVRSSPPRVGVPLRGNQRPVELVRGVGGGRRR
jgi:hypothetical protein